jgi:hypothetical protein
MVLVRSSACCTLESDLVPGPFGLSDNPEADYGKRAVILPVLPSP